MFLLLAAGCGDGAGSTEPPPSTCVDGFTTLPALHQEQASWSSLGEIAYVDRGIVYEDSASGFVITDPSLKGIWVLDVSSGQARRVLPRGESPVWSSDGHRLAFTLSGQVLTVNADGSDQQALTSAGSNFHPSWSSRNDIAFESNRSGPSYELWRMRQDGAQQYRLGPIRMGDSREPSWHPLASRVVFVHFPATSPTEQVFELDSLGVATQLTSNSSLKSSPRYSSDGTRITFTQVRSESQSSAPELWTMAPDGSDARLLVADACLGSWEPAGHCVVYTHLAPCYRDDVGVLWLFDTRTRVSTQLTRKWPASPLP